MPKASNNAAAVRAWTACPPCGRRSEGELTDPLALPILYHMNDLAPELARLTPRQRLDLIEHLWESLEDKDVPVTDAQRAELDRRIAGFDQDREYSIPWNQLKAELQQRR
jgi:putative addiction module component (TIGR02574 family)